MSSVSIAQYAARAEAAETKIAELTNLAGQIQQVLGGAASGGEGGAEGGIGEFKTYFLDKLKALRVVVAAEHEEFVRTKAENAQLQKEVSKLKYRVEILTRELSAKLGTPVPEGIFKAGGEDLEADEDTKEEPAEKEKPKSKDNKGAKGEKQEQKKEVRKPSEKAPSEKAAEVTVHADGAEAGKKGGKGDSGRKASEKASEAPAADAGKKDKAKGEKKDNKKEKAENPAPKEGEAPAEGAKKKGGDKPKEPKEAGKKEEGGKKKEEGGKKKEEGGKKGGERKPSQKEEKTAPKSADGLDDKAVKAAIKEGGKKGQDCAGMSTFGTHFFTVTIESANGNMKLLEKVLEGMNTEVDEAAEDRKGGAGDLGKILFNCNDDKLVILCHTPKEVLEKATAAEWMTGVLEMTEAKVIHKDEHIIKAELDNDPDKGVFVLKRRDAGIAASFDFLRIKGLMPDDDSDEENYAAAAGINLNAGPGADY